MIAPGLLSVCICTKVLELIHHEMNKNIWFETRDKWGRNLSILNSSMNKKATSHASIVKQNMFHVRILIIFWWKSKPKFFFHINLDLIEFLNFCRINWYFILIWHIEKYKKHVYLITNKYRYILILVSVSMERNAIFIYNLTKDGVPCNFK